METKKPIQLKTIIKTSNKIDMAKLIVSFVSLTKNISLSNSETLILSHFVSEGYNDYTKEEILKNKLLKNKPSLSNMISKLRKYGLIKNKGFGEALCDELEFELGDVCMFKILLDNR